MQNNTPIGFHLNIVSAEAEIFSGVVRKLFVSGVMGDLEILRGHAALLTTLQPGPVWIVKQNEQEEVFYISGGMLEIPGGDETKSKTTTIFADTAIRAKDLDSEKALEAKKRAEEMLSSKAKDFDYTNAQTQLLEAIAQLKAVKRLREKRH
jgi:F-type H+-transporting ATPase subunit epsilon